MMSTEKKPKALIGRAETVSLPGVGIEDVHARVDSGARTSAIWASQTVVEGGKLAVVFLGPNHPLYTGQKHFFSAYARDIITSSNGHQELRYKIKLLVVVKNRRIKASFTLADRSTLTYPVLVGRNILRGKFVVDVQFGKTLAEEEKELLRQKRDELNKLGEIS